MEKLFAEAEHQNLSFSFILETSLLESTLLVWILGSTKKASTPNYLFCYTPITNNHYWAFWPEIAMAFIY